MPSPRIIFIAGPTAVGKTDVALFLARQLNGEIISCDSMQIYKELSIVTNKPSAQDLKDVPHHLIGIASVQDDFDVGTFNTLATEAIRGIHARGKLPLVTGGSGLYMQVLLDGIFEGPGEDQALREELKERARDDGINTLYEELRDVDPAAAKKIHPHDLRRIVRALEVYYVTQQPITDLQPQRSGLWGRYNIRIFALNCERRKLYDRIDRRVDKMFEEGLLGEIESIRDKPLSRTAQTIIGLPEVLGFIRGDYPLEEAKEMMKQHTRQLAKRQLTWLRKDQRLEWIEISGDETAETIGQKILKGLS